MKKNYKKYLTFFFFNFLILFYFSKSFGENNTNFLSLKKNEVYLRQGPSFEYPIKLIYKKKYLPVIILDKSGPWRKIKDFQNNTGWIHTALLSKKKSALNIKKNSFYLTLSILVIFHSFFEKTLLHTAEHNLAQDLKYVYL